MALSTQELVSLVNDLPQTKNSALDKLSQSPLELKNIVLEIEDRLENQNLFKLYNWCLKRLKEYVKNNFENRIQELSTHINNYSEYIQQKMDNLGRGNKINHRVVINNQDLSDTLGMERRREKLIHQIEDIQSLIKQIDSINDFHQIFDFLNKDSNL